MLVVFDVESLVEFITAATNIPTCFLSPHTLFHRAALPPTPSSLPFRPPGCYHSLTLSTVPLFYHLHCSCIGPFVQHFNLLNCNFLFHYFTASKSDDMFTPTTTTL
ncbi:unnamed protein product [Gadus morhua 'NCC']